MTSTGNPPVIAAHQCSKWYGPVLGISEVSWSVGTGIIGLLGPNGAGKSTLMKLMAGLMQPSRGSLTIVGQSPYQSAATRARIGYCPEHESMYDELTALEMVTMMAELSGVPRAQAGAAAQRALADMGMQAAQNRLIRGFSKGMRQRTKLATTMVHDPDVVLLDEPLTGVDPLARAEIVEVIRRMGEAGKTVIISSHVLYEIEALTEDILVIYRGQVLAEGNMYRIRELIDQHPHSIRIQCDRPRELAAALAAAEHVRRLSMEPATLPDALPGALVVETDNPDACYDFIASTVLKHGMAVRSLTSPDNNLGAVFEYLTRGHGNASEPSRERNSTARQQPPAASQ